MKILLSAYACEPNKGSEPGVGWNWALEIEKLGHEVWVLTRKNNQGAIEEYFKNNAKIESINFIYYDVPKWLSWWKKGGRGVHLYYFFWQFGAFLKARLAHKRFKFEKIQHITFVTVRQPSFMGLLGVPFIFGPVGGGERAPYALRKAFGAKGWIKDFFRDIVNYLIKFDPFMHVTFKTAREIYVTSEQTKQLIPFFYRKKAKVQLAIGFDESTITKRKTSNKSSSEPLKLLYVGRFEYWKGMGLGIQAFAKLLQKLPNTTLTMVGKGPDEKQWKDLAARLEITDKITWIAWADQSALKKFYQEHDVFLFPSLHDSGGMVVLEAMSNSLPVICLDLGGPGVIVDASSGIKVDLKGLTEEQIVFDLSQAISDLAGNFNHRQLLAQGALIRSTDMNWAAVVNSVYYNSKINTGILLE